MGIFKRLLGICATQVPANSGCWTYANGKLEVLLDKAPELSQKGGAVRLEGPSLPKRVLVVHGQDGAFHAFPNRCTHIGHRRIDPVPGEDKIRCCSVGKSTFEYSGKLISGSAKESLVPLALESDGGKLVISVS
jgi:nitrite reductase/ring-hydroxylating ferredoxin subunit